MVAIEDKSAPGTVQLIDASGELHVKHSKAAKDVVLVPLPSGMYWYRPRPVARLTARR
jgi:hypothetical protein